MNKIDLNKNKVSDDSENIEDPEEELGEENIDEEESIFDFDENFNHTGIFTINQVATDKKNIDSENEIQKEDIDWENQGERNNQNKNINLDEVDFYIPESNHKLMGENTQANLDLLDLDIDSLPKEDLINFLLKSDECSQQKKTKNKFQLKPKNTKPNVLNSVYSNVQNIAENKDPELNEDFNVAMTKVLSKLLKQSDDKNGEILDLLISNREKVEEELKKVKSLL